MARPFANRAGFLALVLMVVAACGELPTAPLSGLNAGDVTQLMPAVTDAFERLAPGLVDEPVARRVGEELRQVAQALTRNDPRGAAFRLRILRGTLAGYLAQPGALDREDAADVMAILFAFDEIALLLEVPTEVTNVP